MKRPEWPSTGGIWTIALLAGMVFAFGWAATRSEEAPTRRPEMADPMASVRDAMENIRDEASTVQTHLHRDVWVRELPPRVVADFRAGEPVSMAWPEGHELSEPEQDSILAVLARPEFARVTDDDIAIGIHVESHPEGVGRGPRAGAILGVHDGTPYCVQVVSFVEQSIHPGYFLLWARLWYRDAFDSSELARFARSDLLAGCTFAHRYGMPGEHIRSWLGTRSTWSGAGLDWLPENIFSARRASRLASDPLDVGRILTGDFPLFGVNVVLRGCLADRRAECMKEFHPVDRRSGPPEPTTVVETPPRSYIAGLGADLLGLIEDDFGSEAFLEFWTSDEPLEVAFAAAFGIHPAEWVRQRAIGEGEALRGGPAPSREAAGTSMLLVLAGLSVGLVAGIRRRVG